MKRLKISPRDDWQQSAQNHGFDFHTPDGHEYWRETACYQFGAAEIEQGLVQPAQEIEAMCIDIVNEVVASEEMLEQLKIPKKHWDYIALTWQQKHKNLYGRMDFAFDGKGAAKLYEYNADTPTSLYESAIFQWLWFEQAAARGLIPVTVKQGDQYNTVHEQLVEAFGRFDIKGILHLACSQQGEDDYLTIEYLEDCARQAGLETKKLFVEQLGLSPDHTFLDLDDVEINTMFKLYPWEMMLRDDFGDHLYHSGCTFIEPSWKAILSNKGLLPLLWQHFEGHPNLLPAFFEDDPAASILSKAVKKPIFSREGWNISVVNPSETAAGSVLATAQDTMLSQGPYGDEGYILQDFHPLPDFDGFRPMCGIWLVASKPAGLMIREDIGDITSYDACFVPHFLKG